jgi:hypothetical protein
MQAALAAACFILPPLLISSGSLNLESDYRANCAASCTASPARRYRHFGSFAYVGMDHAVLDLPSTFPFNTLKGWLVGLTWRGFETWGQARGGRGAGGGKGLAGDCCGWQWAAQRWQGSCCSAILVAPVSPASRLCSAH